MTNIHLYLIWDWYIVFKEKKKISTILMSNDKVTYFFQSSRLDGLQQQVCATGLCADLLRDWPARTGDRRPVPLARVDPLLEVRDVSDQDGRSWISVAVMLAHEASQNSVTISDTAHHTAPVKLEREGERYFLIFVVCVCVVFFFFFFFFFLGGGGGISFILQLRGFLIYLLLLTGLSNVFLTCSEFRSISYHRTFFFNSSPLFIHELMLCINSAVSRKLSLQVFINNNVSLLALLSKQLATPSQTEQWKYRGIRSFWHERESALRRSP